MTVTAQKVSQSLELHGWPGRGGSVRFLASGEYNENWLVEGSDGSFVFRLNHGSQLGLADQIGYEYKVLKAAEPSGVTPRAFGVDPADPVTGKGVLLMEFLPGGPLEYKSNSLEAARLLAAIHKVPVAPESCGLLVQSDPIADVVRESRGLLQRTPVSFYPRVRDQLTALAGALSIGSSLPGGPLCLVNTELNSGNFLWDGERLRLVDWEKAVVSSRFQDLAHFLSPTTTLWKTDTVFDSKEREAFLRTYQKASDTSFTYQELFLGTSRMEKAVRLRALSWCLMAGAEYSTAQKALAHSDTAAKIIWYLDNAEMLLQHGNVEHTS